MYAFGKAGYNALILAAEGNFVDRAAVYGEVRSGFVVFVAALGEGKGGVEIIAVIVGVDVYIIMGVAAVGRHRTDKGKVAGKGGAVESDGKSAGAVSHSQTVFVIKGSASDENVL